MKSFMEMIYVAADGSARHTDLALQLSSDRETYAKFRSFKRYESDSKSCRFLLDYHNAKGDLVDTIRLDRGGFIAITGQRPKLGRAYRRIDELFWRRARETRKHGCKISRAGLAA